MSTAEKVEAPKISEARESKVERGLMTMKFFNTKKKRLLTAVVVVALLAGAAGVYVYKHRLKSDTVAAVSPLSITPGPAGLIGGAAPNSSGGLWVLVSLNGKANVQLIYTSSKVPPVTFPVSNTASTVAVNYDGTLGVGLATGKTGAVQFYKTPRMTTLGTVALPGPVTALVDGTSGNAFYALVSVRGAESVDVVNAVTHKITLSIPMPAQTDSIAISPDQSTVYALQGNGTVSVIDAASHDVIQSFAVTPGDRQLAISPDGSQLYVLKGSVASDNVAVINLATQSTVRVLPAPASCQGIVVSPGGQLYDLVGTSNYGNIQVFSTKA
jgi:hypothetical protein